MRPVENVLTWFEAQCARRPDTVAVVDAVSTRTYAQLDAEVSGYAAALAAAGAGPERVVPVVAARGGHYVAMLLGVLRAGAAFLPIGPDTPVRRARDMCAIVGASVLLVQPDQEQYALRLIGAGQRIVSAQPGLRAPGFATPRREPDALAYVIFTSGSTGAPKGAMVTDAGLANHTAAKTIDLALGPDDAVGFTASLSFDISVWQALTALTVGARVAIASPVDVSEPFELLTWVRRHGVTVLELVPSYLAVMLDELELDPGQVRTLGTLRYLIATGEALALPLARRWYTLCPDIALVNAYGPTECSDDVTHHIVTKAECDSGRPPSIGREILNTRIYLVDADGEQVPPGVDGEMLVGGAGVGRGYIGDPVRTALAFVPDHLSGQPGARLYRTGDRARRAADGTIDFLGRRDRQIKLRGQRVELGEVEAELSRVPGVVSAAAVFVQERLHAFVTGASDGALDADAVLRAMRDSAPGFLVPHDVIVLDRLPSNANGKVDYAALARRLAPAVARSPLVTPELTLPAVCAAVAEILDVARVGADDDFFAVGGDSLLAMRLLSLARERFNAFDAPLRGFLTDPTPRRLLGVLAEAGPARAAPETDETASTALSSGQERLWFLEQLHPSRYVQLIRFRVVLRGELDLPALEHALAAVIARHEPLRTTVSQERGKPSAIIAPHAKLDLAVVAGRADDLPPHIDADGLSARTGTPPLMRAQLIRHAPDEHVLNLVLHHLIADGFSIGVLGAEIGYHYRRYRDGEHDVPAPASSYSRYVGEERRWLASADAAASERFWRDELAGAPDVVDLPFSRPHPARPTFHADHVVRTLTPAQTAAVRDAARAGRATPIMAVTAALTAVLRQLTNGDDLVVGLDSANRSWPGSDELIGTFVNQLPLRLRSEPGSWSYAALLDLVRRQSLAAYAHDRLPFHKIVAAVNPQRRAGRFPLFQVKVTHQGAWRDSLTLPGLDVGADVLSEPVTDLDLMLDVSGEATRLRLELVYRSELLDEDVAHTWIDAIVDVLRAGAADPDATLAPLLADHAGRREGRPR